MGMAKRMMEDAERIGIGSVVGGLCPEHVVDSYFLNLVHDREAGECRHCGAARDDLLPAESMLRPMLELISQEWGVPTSSYSSTSDIFELFYNYFDDVFDEDDPFDIFEWLATGVDRYEWTNEMSSWDVDDDDDDEPSTSSKWAQFSKLVQHESRFIFLTAGPTRSPEGGATAAGFVNEFEQILRQNEGVLVRDIEPGHIFFRGRMANSLRDVAKLSNARELGPAPSDSAAASRMSPAGISMFYASETAATAVAEIASHDSQQREFAVVGGFKSLSQLRVLDLMQFDLPSIFDEGRREARSNLLFLRQFADDITKPIRLDGRQHREYSPTQILTELIRWSKAPDVDGIRLRSAQDGEPTYVLFSGPKSVKNEGDPIDGSMFSLATQNIQVVEVERRVTVSPLSPFRLAALASDPHSGID